MRQQGTQRPPNLQRPPQQGVPSSPGPRQQINPLVARGKDANFAQSDLRKRMSEAISTLATNIKALQKENAELKAKLAEAQKNPKTQ
jgi:hypothetical protein